MAWRPAHVDQRASRNTFAIGERAREPQRRRAAAGTGGVVVVARPPQRIEHRLAPAAAAVELALDEARAALQEGVQLIRREHLRCALRRQFRWRRLLGSGGRRRHRRKHAIKVRCR